MKQKILDGKTSTGSNSAYCIEIDGPGYYDGQTIRFVANHTNTGDSTLSVSGKTAIALKKKNNQSLLAGDIEANQVVLVSYEATNGVFEILSELASETSVANNSITFNKLTEDVIKEIRVPISSAEILALRTTPKELIPAPGVGKVISLSGVIIKTFFGTTAYTVDMTSSLNIRYEGGFISIIAFDGTPLTATFDIIHSGRMTSTLNIIENARLILNDGSGVNPTLGDGTLEVILTYRIITL